MLASIIIPTYGSRLDYLRDTLISVQQQDFSNDDYEIIVIDNGPNNVLPIIDELNASGHHTIRYVKETQKGLLKARHAGAYNAKGRILVYIDDDIIASPGWLKSITEPFEDPNVGCAGGKVLPQWEAEVPEWFSQFKPAHLSILDLGDERKELTYAGLWGCNVAFRRDYFFASGGSYPEIISGKASYIWLMGSGECGLEEKLYNLGFKIIYEPQAWLYHRIPASRLTPKYFYWRLFMQGVDDSYRYIRDMRIRNTRLFYSKIVKEILFNAIRSGMAFMKSLILSKRRIRLKAESRYWYARGGHHLRTLFSKKMRQHVFQDSYL